MDGQTHLPRLPEFLLPPLHQPGLRAVGADVFRRGGPPSAPDVQEQGGPVRQPHLHRPQQRVAVGRGVHPGHARHRVVVSQPRLSRPLPGLQPGPGVHPIPRL